MLAEAGPLLVPQFDAALVSLGLLVLLIVALGLINLMDAFVRAFFGAIDRGVGWIPWLGHVITQPVDKIGQKAINILGTAEQKVDKQIGRWFGSLAKLIEWVGHEIRRHAGLLSILATVMVGPAAVGLIKATFHAIRYEIKHAKAQLAYLYHELAVVIPNRAKALERSLGHRIAHAAAVAGGVIVHDIPGIRAGLRSLHEALDKWRARLRSLEKRLGRTAILAAVIAALAKLGIGWARCSNWNKLGKAGCRLPVHFLNDLIAIIADFTVLTNLCTVIAWLEDGYAVVEGPLVALISDATQGVCHGKSFQGVTLDPPPLQLPDASLDLRLPLSV